MSETNGTPAVLSPTVEGPLTTGLPLRPVALAGLTVVLIALCVYLGWPFFPALITRAPGAARPATR